MWTYVHKRTERNNVKKDLKQEFHSQHMNRYIVYTVLMTHKRFYFLIGSIPSNPDCKSSLCLCRSKNNSSIHMRASVKLSDQSLIFQANRCLL